MVTRLYRLAKAFVLFWIAAPTLFALGVVEAISGDDEIRRMREGVADVVLNSFAHIDAPTTPRS